MCRPGQPASSSCAGVSEAANACRIDSLSYSSNAGSTRDRRSSRRERRGDELRRLALSFERAGVDAVDRLAERGEVAAENGALLAPDRGELIVVVGAERSLAVPDEVDDAHPAMMPEATSR